MQLLALRAPACAGQQTGFPPGLSQSADHAQDEDAGAALAQMEQPWPAAVRPAYNSTHGNIAVVDD